MWCLYRDDVSIFQIFAIGTWPVQRGRRFVALYLTVICALYSGRNYEPVADASFNAEKMAKHRGLERNMLLDTPAQRQFIRPAKRVMTAGRKKASSLNPGVVLRCRFGFTLRRSSNIFEWLNYISDVSTNTSSVGFYLPV